MLPLWQHYASQIKSNYFTVIKAEHLVLLLPWFRSALRARLSGLLSEAGIVPILRS